MKLPKGVTKESIEVIAHNTGIQLSQLQFENLIKQDRHLMVDLDELGPDDTDIKGQLLSMISKKLLNREWPTHGDNIDMDTFYADLKDKALMAGYAIED